MDAAHERILERLDRVLERLDVAAQEVLNTLPGSREEKIDAVHQWAARNGSVLLWEFLGIAVGRPKGAKGPAMTGDKPQQHK